MDYNNRHELLVKRYGEFLKEENLPSKSADEFKPGELTEYQQGFVNRFIRLWEISEREEREPGILERVVAVDSVESGMFEMLFTNLIEKDVDHLDDDLLNQILSMEVGEIIDPGLCADIKRIK